mgnify:CR=1 FL=1
MTTQKLNNIIYDNSKVKQQHHLWKLKSYTTISSMTTQKLHNNIIYDNSKVKQQHHLWQLKSYTTTTSSMTTQRLHNTSMGEY